MSQELNAYKDFIAFMDHEVINQRISQTTKDTLLHTVAQHTKTTSGFLGIGAKKAQDVSKEETLNALLKDVVDLEVIGSGSYTTLDELWSVFKRYQQEKQVSLYDTEAQSWIKQLQSKIEQRENEEQYVPTGYDSTTLLDKFTEQLRRIGFDWLKKILTLRTLFVFSSKNTDSISNEDIQSFNPEELQHTIFMKEWFWSLYTGLDKENEQGMGFITQVETYTTTFIDDFITHLEKEYIPALERRLGLIELALQDSWNEYDVTHASKDVQRAYENTYAKYKDKRILFTHEKKLRQKQKEGYPQVLSALMRFRDVRKQQEQYFMDTQVLLEQAYAYIHSEHGVPLESGQILELKKHLKERMSDMPICAEICLTIIADDTQNILIESEKNKRRTLADSALNKENGWKVMIEKVISQLEEKRRTVLGIKDANIRCHEYIDQSTQFMKNYFDNNISNASHSITTMHSEEVSMRFKNFFDEYTLIQKAYQDIVNEKEDIDEGVWEQVEHAYNTVTQSYLTYIFPRQEYLNATMQTIDAFADNHFLLQAAKKAQIKTTEHILWLTVLVSQGKVLFDDGLLKVLRYNEKNYLCIQGFTAEVSDEELCTKHLEQIFVVDEFGNQKRVSNFQESNDTVHIQASHILKNNACGIVFEQPSLYFGMSYIASQQGKGASWEEITTGLYASTQDATMVSRCLLLCSLDVLTLVSLFSKTLSISIAEMSTFMQDALITQDKNSLTTLCIELGASASEIIKALYTLGMIDEYIVVLLKSLHVPLKEIIVGLQSIDIKQKRMLELFIQAGFSHEGIVLDMLQSFGVQTLGDSGILKTLGSAQLNTPNVIKGIYTFTKDVNYTIGFVKATGLNVPYVEMVSTLYSLQAELSEVIRVSLNGLAGTNISTLMWDLHNNGKIPARDIVTAFKKAGFTITPKDITNSFPILNREKTNELLRIIQ